MPRFIKSNPDDITYFTQRNNVLFPLRSCFPTSMAMAMRNNGFKYVEKFKDPTYGTLELDDYIMQLVNSPMGQTWADKLGIPKGTKFLNEYWGPMVTCGNYLLNPQNIKCKQKAMTMDSIKAEIDAGRMVLIGTYFTTGGHIVTISGYTEDGRLIVCDPYGNRNFNYPFSMNGKNVVLNKELHSKLLFGLCIVFEKITLI